MNHFQHEQLTTHIIRIIELGGVACYLVIGDDKACLLDTGCGYGDLKGYAETLTKLPIFVVLTHAHLDHMGNAAQFEEVYLNTKEASVFAQQGLPEVRYEETQRFPETMHLQLSDLTPTRTKPFLPIEDEQVFDLGNVHIQMIPVYGHTPGMMCPLIIEDRAIVFGDACGLSVLIFKEFQSLTISEYRKSLLHLKTYEASYDTILRNHGSFTSEKGLLDNVIACCDLILEKKDDHFPCQFHEFDLFAAKEFSWKHGRTDGKEGNILYSMDKAK